MSDDSQRTATIAEQLQSFQKHLWGHDKPMDFATEVVHELLLEIQRQRTVMRAAHDEVISRMVTSGDVHPQFENLMHSLLNQRNGFYAQYLSPEEYTEFIRRQSSFDVFEQMLNGEE